MIELNSETDFHIQIIKMCLKINVILLQKGNCQLLK